MHYAPGAICSGFSTLGYPVKPSYLGGPELESHQIPLPRLLLSPPARAPSLCSRCTRTQVCSMLRTGWGAPWASEACAVLSLGPTRALPPHCVVTCLHAGPVSPIASLPPPHPQKWGLGQDGCAS